MPLLTRFGGAKAFGLMSKVELLPGGYVTGRDTTTAHKMVYSTEVVSALSWSRSTGGNMGTGLGNANVAGYLMNGGSGEKILFESDTKAASAPVLSTSRGSSAGASNSGSFGYAMGGDTPATTVDKFTYSTDTRTTLGTGLSVAKYGSAGFGNQGVAAYAAAGDNAKTSTDKIAFSNDSRSTLGAALSVGRGYATGASNSGTAGYIGGGFVDVTTYGTNIFEKITYSTDSRSTLGATMPEGRWAVSGFHKQGVAGYFAGGCNAPSNYAGLNTIVKINYSNDSVSTNASTMSTLIAFGIGVSNSIQLGNI